MRAAEENFVQVNHRNVTRKYFACCAPATEIYRCLDPKVWPKSDNITPYSGKNIHYSHFDKFIRNATSFYGRWIVTTLFKLHDDRKKSWLCIFNNLLFRSILKFRKNFYDSADNFRLTFSHGIKLTGARIQCSSVEIWFIGNQIDSYQVFHTWSLIFFPYFFAFCHAQCLVRR